MLYNMYIYIIYISIYIRVEGYLIYEHVYCRPIFDIERLLCKLPQVPALRNGLHQAYGAQLSDGIGHGLHQVPTDSDVQRAPKLVPDNISYRSIRIACQIDAYMISNLDPHYIYIYTDRIVDVYYIITYDRCSHY